MRGHFKNLLIVLHIEQQCFELDSQLQLLQEQGRKEECLFQELTQGKALIEADLASSQEQLKLVGSKLALYTELVVFNSLRLLSSIF